MPQNGEMDDGYSIIVPDSFVALFRTASSQRLSEPKHHILARYELCEDLAQALVAQAQARLFDLGVAQWDVLKRIHQGLMEPHSPVAPEEATWIVRRLAELLGWEDLGALGGGDGASG